ncbi:DNA-processing protein DprA [Staphylococcus coagulans]|uniref:DNA-processing protein DprA n=1 Tax=Staphylococcus coagulans TaxID=74706 RepID=UPI0033650310
MMKQLLLLLLYAGFTTQQLQKMYPILLALKGNVDGVSNYLNEMLKMTSSQSIVQKIRRFRSLEIDTIESDLKRHRIIPIAIHDPLYPSQLKEIHDPPFILFCKGNLQTFKTMKHTLAIVGARRCTNYTPQALSYLFKDLSEYSITIISGLAHGTDALAHQFALDYHMHTIGILGFGHHHHYPTSTLQLRQKIENQFLTISEYPPHTPIAKFRFPERNRLISGLSQGVLITEARARSGALITLDQALEQNRNVYVLPGDIFNQNTRGNLLRVKEGAELVLSAQDILKDYKN